MSAAEEQPTLHRPTKGTPEWDLWIAAIQIATPPPLARHGRAATTAVPWSRVEALRSSLDALGIDWRKVKAADNEKKEQEP